jgi:hypothetical protein
MHADRWFRLLHHATLAVASICLLNAEQTFLPGVHWYMAPVVLVVALAWRMEGRWRLPVWAANLIGIALLAGFGLLVRQLLHDPDSWLQRARMPAGMVPLLGPLLIALLLVRLFRPRVAADFWLLQGFGALQVGLACVIGTGPELGMLLPVYLACVLGCLVEHFLVAGQAKASPSEVSGQPHPPEARTPTGGVRLGRFLLVWVPLVGALTVLLFLVLPRPDVTEWERPTGSYGGVQGAPPPQQSGMLGAIDMETVGWVDLSSDVAFTVEALDSAGRPVLDLPAEQRWRYRVLDFYSRDRKQWLFGSPVHSGVGGPRDRPMQLSQFGPSGVVLTFDVNPHDAGGLFLADPIRLGPDPTETPVTSLDILGQPQFYELLGTVLPRRPNERERYRYRQSYVPHRGRGEEYTPALAIERRYIPYLLTQPLAPLDDWTVALVRRLATDPRYRLQGVLPPPAPDGSARGFVLDPDDWERVARALTDYLAASGEYSYSLELRREDADLDPTLDFLWKVKQGTCERYASALTLMLRAVGIPARIVKGYRGLEHEGDGRYVVRQNQAHSWVEALVSGTGKPFEMNWLTLDPTPIFDSAGGDAFSLARLLDRSQRKSQFFWQELIIHYNSSSRAELLQHLPLPSWQTLGALGGIVAVLAVLFLLRRRRRGHRASQRAAHESASRIYGRLLYLLHRHLGLVPAPAQTPRTFAREAEVALTAAAHTGSVATVPVDVVEWFYRARFGAVPLSADEILAVDRQLSALAEAFQQRTAAVPAPA